MENSNNNRLQTEESRFLRGPLSRFKELFFTFKVQFSFIKAFRKMHFIGPCVTVFGSARFNTDNPYCQQAEKVGAALANLGFLIFRRMIRKRDSAVNARNTRQMGFLIKMEKSPRLSCRA